MITRIATAALCSIVIQNAMAWQDNYTVVSLTDLNPAIIPSWERDSDAPLHYPRSLAMNEIAGCGIFDVLVGLQGQTEAIRLITASPAQLVSLPAQRLIESWQWQPAGNAPAAAETKRIRLDFCYSRRSQSDAAQMCRAQREQSCL